ncbi:MAG: hypothetical protein E7482_03120 [Ruminococcaceae bacterium]|nr:hypothetical protein [Oscillospiraceae bacterium]
MPPPLCGFEQSFSGGFPGRNPPFGKINKQKFRIRFSGGQIVKILNQKVILHNCGFFKTQPLL